MLSQQGKSLESLNQGRWRGCRCRCRTRGLLLTNCGIDRLTLNVVFWLLEVNGLVNKVEADKNNKKWDFCLI